LLVEGHLDLGHGATRWAAPPLICTDSTWAGAAGQIVQDKAGLKSADRPSDGVRPRRPVGRERHGRLGIFPTMSA